jgi:hypothetical protein
VENLYYVGFHLETVEGAAIGLQRGARPVGRQIQ